MLKDSRKIAAILAADVVEYSRLMGADETSALDALKLRRGIFNELVAELEGQEFGSVGDSLMAKFASAVNAVLCAQAIQQRVEAENATLPAARRMQLRIGVNLGDVIEENGVAFGDTVNIAARLQALAHPGGVLISGTVYDQVHLKVPARYLYAGVRQVKNVSEPVRTFEVLPPRPQGWAGKFAAFRARVASRRVRHLMAGVLVLAAAALLGMFWRELLPTWTADRAGGLRALRGGEAAPNSIAVLPFVNMSGDPANDYLGDGLSEELANRLTKIRALRVAARTSVFAFKGKDMSVGEIAARLGVRYVVEGSVKLQGDRFRVTAALVEGASGTNRWANSYEPASADYLAVESDIAAKVITALELVLGKQATTSPRPPDRDSGVAYDFYLQGLAYLRQPKSARTLAAAGKLFTRALEEQPDFARAQAGLCETYVGRFALERNPVYVAAAEQACANATALDSGAHDVYMAVGRLRLATGDAEQAEESYRRALALAPQSPDALLGLADALSSGGKTAEAEEAYVRAIGAQPSYAIAHVQYGNFLFSHGRAPEAVTAYERATALAPDNPTALSNLGGAYLLMGDFEKAAEASARSLAIEPRQASYSNIAYADYYRGRFSEAVDMYRKAIALAPSDHRLWGNLADAQYFGGRPVEARESWRRALELADGELAVNPKHAVNQAQAAYYATRLGEPGRARRTIAIALAEGGDDVYVQYYAALAELGLGNRASALAHARRARELGYAKSLMRAAPELAEIRSLL